MDRLAHRGVERQHRKRERQVLAVRRDGHGAGRPSCPPDDATEDGRPRRSDLHLDKSRKPDVATVDRRDMDADDLVASASSYPLIDAISRAAASAATGSARTNRAPARAAASAAFCSSRLWTSMLPTSNARAAMRSRAMSPPAKRTRTCPRSRERLVVDDKARLRCHGDRWKGDEGNEARVRVTGSHGHGGTACVVPSSVGRKVAGRGWGPPTPVDEIPAAGTPKAD